MTIPRHLSLFLVCVLLVGVPQMPEAAAQSGQSSQRSYKELSKTERRELASLIEAGRAAYDNGKFERALRYFKDAHQLFAHPDLQYRIGLCYEKLGEPEEATAHYKRFLEEVPDAEERGRIEQTIRMLEAQMADRASKIRVRTTPSNARVFVNDEVSGSAGSTPVELMISAGNYKLIIKKDGYEPVVESVDVPEGQTVVVHYSLTPRPTTDGADSAPVVGPLILGTVGLIAGTGALVSYFEYTDKRDKIQAWDALKDQGGERPPQYNDTFEDMELFRGVGWATGGVAAASLLGATIWWIAGRSGGQAALGAPADAAAFALTPVIAPSGSGASVGARLDF